MDSYELNKIAGAVLGTVLLTLGVHTLATELFSVHMPETPGFDVQVADGGDDHGGTRGGLHARGLAGHRMDGNPESKMSHPEAAGAGRKVSSRAVSPTAPSSF